MPGAVLCDVDGVIRHFGSDHGLEARYGLPPGTVAAAAFTPARLRPAITGKISDQQWRDAVAGDLADACGSVRRAQALAEWGSPATCRIDTAVVALLMSARRRVPLALVSNAPPRLEEDLASLGPGRPGRHRDQQRPDRSGQARRCLFVDDSAENVRAARALGMTGLVYRQPGDLRLAHGQFLPGQPS